MKPLYLKMCFILFVGYLLISCSFLAAHADEDSWYDVAPEAYQLAPQGGGVPRPDSPYSAPRGYRPPDPNQKPANAKKWWQVWKADDPPGQPVEKIVEVGPREYPSAPDPLLRLGFSLRQERKVVPGGVYLVRLSEPDGTMTLLRGSQTMLTLPMQKLAGSAAPQGPVEPLPEDKNRHKEEVNQGPYRNVTVQYDAGRLSITLLYQLGQSFYQSEPVAIAY